MSAGFVQYKRQLITKLFGTILMFGAEYYWSSVYSWWLELSSLINALVEVAGIYQRILQILISQYL
jgi:hypothetical protein